MRFLIIAVLLFSTPIAAQDVARSADPKLRTTIDRELVYLIQFGQVGDIRLLLDRGADAGQTNEAGWPLVSIAASRTDGQAVPVMRELIKRGADINQGGPSRVFPVLVAARRGDAEMMDFLLDEALADFDVRDLNGVKASEIARKNGYDAIADKMATIEKDRKSAKAGMYSAERRDRLMKEATLSGCAISYLEYYYGSKQDKVPENVQAETIADWRSRQNVATNDLQQIFRFKPYETLLLGTAASSRLRSELDAFVSNRNRRNHGFGASGDLEARCGKISEQVLKQSDDDAKSGRKRTKPDVSYR